MLKKVIIFGTLLLFALVLAYDISKYMNKPVANEEKIAITITTNSATYGVVI